MSIEFIAAKDLPVAEGNEVDVLCVENGELKRKEGASLGGGGGIKYDAVISVTGNPYMVCDFSECDISANATEILNIVEKLKNNEFVNVAIKYYYTYGANEYYSFIPASVRCRAEGTPNTGDNQLNIGFFLTTYHDEFYTVKINFNTEDGSYINSSYKTMTLS